MRLAWVCALLVVAGCGKITGDDSVSTANDPDSGSAVTIDASPGKKAPIDSMQDASVPYSPIDTSSWSMADTVSNCSFDVRFDEENAPPLHVVGTRVAAAIDGTEIPYVGFGCSGTIASETITFIGGTLNEDGVDGGQWAYVDYGNFSYFVDDEHISECDLYETTTGLQVGNRVSGTFSCGEIPGAPAPLNVSNGRYDTIFLPGRIDLP